MNRQGIIPGSIFLSHTKTDKPFVRELARKLETYGITAWVDEASMVVGDSLIEKIQEGISTMDYLGVVLSPNSVVSEWVQKELKVALNLEIAEKRVKVLPILFRDCEIPIFLQDKLYVDFRNLKPNTRRFEKMVEQLLKRLLPESDIPTDKVNLILHQLYSQWNDYGLLIEQNKLDYLYERRERLRVNDHNWLALAESSLALNDFARWTGLVSNSQIWTAVKYVLTTSKNNTAVRAASSVISNKACFNQPDYAEFAARMLSHKLSEGASETLAKAIARIPDPAVFDEVVTLYIEKFKDANSDEKIVSLIQGKPHWYKKMGTGFFITFLNSPHFITEETHEALEAIISLGDKSAIQPLKKLHSDGFGGNEPIGERYLDKIEETLKSLGADISDLKR